MSKKDFGKPGLKPLTVAALYSVNLVGKKVICLNSGYDAITRPLLERGAVYTVRKAIPEDETIRLAEIKSIWHISRFALAPNQSEPVTEELEHLTTATACLVGKKVICLNDHNGPTCVELERGAVYTVRAVSPRRGREIIRLAEIEGVWRINRFALAPDQSEPEPDVEETGYEVSMDGFRYPHVQVTSSGGVPLRIGSPPEPSPSDHDDVLDADMAAAGTAVRQPPEQPPVETTHSTLLKFPNGELVDIPAPGGDGWAEEILWDEWTEPDGKQASAGWSYGFPTICTPADWCPVAVLNSAIVMKEYFERIRNEKPFMVSCSRWTRTVPEPVEPERYEAYRNYPLLLGEE